MLNTKRATCPCGNVIEIPLLAADDINCLYEDEYDVSNQECTKCGRSTTSGNWKTGEVTGWITRRDAEASQAEYERQCFSSEMNEWYGRGNHPF